MSLYEEMHALYQKYVKELNTFRKTSVQMPENEVRKTCDEYIQASNSSWHNIYDPESKDLVGFLIIGKEFPEKHPDSLRSVAQAYVLPEYRKKGLMTAVMKDYMTRHKGFFEFCYKNQRINNFSVPLEKVLRRTRIRGGFSGTCS